MITIREKNTGCEMNVSNVNEKAGRLIGRYEFSKRFYNKYGHAVECVGHEGDKPILRLREGWEIVTQGRKRVERVEEAQPQPQEQEQPQEKEQGQERPKQPQVEAVSIPSMEQAVDAFAALTPLFAGVQRNVEQAIMAKVQPILDRAPVEHVHTIVRPDGERVDMKGEVFHPNFDSVLNRVALGQWVYLYGPTGSGKNVMAEQIARALGLDFYYQAHTLDRFELTGFIDAAGTYQPSELYKAYTLGGLYMLDELDASEENALITMNSAANGYFAFPCGTVKAHPDFRVIAAGNTCGRGATEDYTARRVMDASSLGRFIPRFHGYCREVDMAAAQGDETLVGFFHALREVKKETGVQMLLSPRQIKSIKALESMEALAQLLTDTLATYLSADELSIVQAAIKAREDMKGNAYAKAFADVQAIEY